MPLYNNVQLEEQFLIRIIKDYIHEQPTTTEDNIDWERAGYLLHKHQLSAIAYFQCKLFSGSEDLKNAYFTTISTSANRKKMYDAVIKEFDENGIDYIPYKGIILANYYPQPLCRTMGDVDILIPDIDRAIDVMNLLGFCGQQNKEEWSWRKNGIEFEIHSKFFCNNVSLTDKQKKFFEDYEGYVHDHQLDVSYHFLLIICHLMKHIKNGQGIGLRQFLDVALMIKEEKCLNWEWIFKNAEEIELLKFMSITLNFVNSLFGIPLPSQTIPIPEETLQVLLESVMVDGSFQSSSYKRKIAKEVNGTTKNQSLSMLFPPIRYMQEKYAYLGKAPILLPISWLDRIVNYVFSEKRTSKKRIVTKSEDIDNRKHYLSMLGIQ